MKKLKALIIENEYEVDNSIQAFLKDNPKLFASVNEQTFCRNRRVEDLKRFIMQSDAIIIASTFGMDEKEQADQYLSLFNSPKFPKKLTIYVHHFVNKVNSWSYEKDIWFEDRKLFDAIVSLYKKGWKFYDFYEQSYSDSKTIVDDLNLFHEDKERWPYQQFAVEFNEESELFYLPESKRSYTLDDVKEDKKEYIKKHKND